MGPTEQTRSLNFRCNICGQRNDKPLSAFGREVASCDGCGSSVRTRGLVRMIAREIVGVEMAVPDFPVLKSVRGVGMSDPDDFAQRLAAKFDYRNTHFDRQPRLDVLAPGPGDIGAYDFIVCSEILEHVAAPVERAFENLFRMLKPNGLLLMTVPYRPEGDVREHFGPMQGFGLADVDGRTVLVRRSADGGYEVLPDLEFHGGHGSTLEMRVFSESSLRERLAAAGFEAQIYTEPAPEFGVIHDETWSLPIAARKGRFALGVDARREWAEQWLARRLEAAEELDRELRARAEWAGNLSRELEEKTTWAFRLQAEAAHDRSVADDLRRQLNQRNTDAQALVAEFDRRMAIAQSEMYLLKAQLEAAREGARAKDELALARERIAVLETLLRQRLWSRIKRKLGVAQGKPEGP